MRIAKFLAAAGVDSRRKCDKLVRNGLVTVNGKVNTDLTISIAPEQDEVRVDGQRVEIPRTKVYIVLNKPPGILTTVRDEKGRTTVRDLVPVSERVFPVGRLDGDSTGLLLLTNDGDLAHRCTHPRFGVRKTYVARLNNRITEKELRRLRQGIRLQDGPTAPAEARKLNTDTVELIIHEGRNKQVKRMFRKLGYKVRELHRVAYGPVLLGRLKDGHWRKLKPVEIKSLKEQVGLN